MIALLVAALVLFVFLRVLFRRRRRSLGVAVAQSFPSPTRFAHTHRAHPGPRHKGGF